MSTCECGHEKELHSNGGLCIVGRFVPAGTPDDYPMCDCTEYRENQEIRCSCLCHGSPGSIGPCGHCYEDEKRAGPGDGGPCPECGEDMAAKVYEHTDIFGEPRQVSGRYWHMKNEHSILEDYKPRRVDDRE